MSSKNCFSIQVSACPKKTIEELVIDAIRLATLLKVNVDFKFYGISVSINEESVADAEIEKLNSKIDQQQYLRTLSIPD